MAFEYRTSFQIVLSNGTWIWGLTVWYSNGWTIWHLNYGLNCPVFEWLVYSIFNCMGLNYFEISLLGDFHEWSHANFSVFLTPFPWMQYCLSQQQPPPSSRCMTLFKNAPNWMSKLILQVAQTNIHSKDLNVKLVWHSNGWKLSNSQLVLFFKWHLNYRFQKDRY